MNDELREQLGQLDPMHPGVPVESPTTPSSRARLEHTMNTPIIDQVTSTHTKGHPSDGTPMHTAIGRHRRRNWTIVAGGDAATVVLQGSSGSPALIDGFAFEAGEQ